jgi:pimeloyl-ACP methyl ester carboxylesterase
MGGAVAAYLAATRPQRVAALVLLAPAGYPGSLHYSGYFGALMRSPLRGVARYVANTRWYEALFPRSLAAQALGVTASYDSVYAAELRRIRQPTRIYWGEDDKTVPFAYSRVFAERIPHADVVPWSDAGHDLMASHAPELAASICQFVHSLLFVQEP